MRRTQGRNEWSCRLFAGPGYFPVKSKVRAIIGLCIHACLSAVFINAYVIIIACNVCFIVSCCSFSVRGIVPRTHVTSSPHKPKEIKLYRPHLGLPALLLLCFLPRCSKRESNAVRGHIVYISVHMPSSGEDMNFRTE